MFGCTHMFLQGPSLWPLGLIEYHLSGQPVHQAQQNSTTTLHSPETPSRSLVTQPQTSMDAIV